MLFGVIVVVKRLPGGVNGVSVVDGRVDECSDDAAPFVTIGRRAAWQTRQFLFLLEPAMGFVLFPAVKFASHPGAEHCGRRVDV